MRGRGRGCRCESESGSEGAYVCKYASMCVCMCGTWEGAARGWEGQKREREQLGGGCRRSGGAVDGIAGVCSGMFLYLGSVVLCVCVPLAVSMSLRGLVVVDDGALGRRAVGIRLGMSMGAGSTLYGERHAHLFSSSIAPPARPRPLPYPPLPSHPTHSQRHYRALPSCPS